MKSFVGTFVILAFLFAAVNANTFYVLTANHDTWATQNLGYGSGCVINGADTSLAINKGWGTLEVDTLVRFGTASFSGCSSIVSANFSLSGCGTGLNSASNIRFYESPLFDEATASWTSALSSGGAPGCPNWPTVGTSLGKKFIMTN